jgi:ribosome biogenesis protein ENP2
MAISDIKVYTVNGPSTSSSLPDWITKKTGKSKKHQNRERVQTNLQLIQDFTFPQTGTKIRTTRDGHHAIGIGTYKPQMRCWDVNQLTLKFERVTDSEGIDFVVSSIFSNLFSLDNRFRSYQMTGQRHYTCK